MTEQALVVDVTAQSFERDVLLRSAQQAVLVDFWAAWCGPCRSLTPVLERVVQSYAGDLLLAKVDTDAEQELATRHGIRSLPTVRLYRDAEVVAEFMGARPESEIRAILEPHLPRASDGPLAGALQLASAGDTAGAIALLEPACKADPSSERLAGTLLELYLRDARVDAARALLDALPADWRDHDWVRAAGARLLFAGVARDAEPAEALQARLDANPADHEARYHLGAHLAADGEIEAALEALLGLVKANRGYGEDAGRRGMLAIFDLLGDRHPLVGQFRQRMASALY